MQTASASHSVSCLSILLPLVLVLLQTMTKFPSTDKGGIIDALTMANGAAQIGTLNVAPTTTERRTSSWARR